MRFADRPSHARAVTERYPVVALFSLPPRGEWLAPAVLWHAPNGFDGTDKPELHPHLTLTVQFDRAPVRRVNARGERREAGGQRQRGELWLQPSDTEHRFRCDEAIRFGHIYFTSELIRAAAIEAFGERGDRDELFDPGRMMRTSPEVRALADAYLSRIEGADPRGGRLEMDARATLLAFAFVRMHSVLPQGRTLAVGSLAPWQERRTIEYLAHNLATNVSLGELAAIAGLSTFHFARMFKMSTGLPPFAYLRQLRCERAKELLTGTDLPVTAIAARVGYDTPQGFARMFRGEVGASPTEYRRHRRG